MTVEVRTLPEDDDKWNRYVEQSPLAGPFHRTETLSVLATHAGGTCYRYVGYKGQEPVGIFPVFELQRGPVTAAFSPPPKLSIPFLGPALLNRDKLKQRKAERRHRRFLDACFDRIDGDVSSRYSKITTGDGYVDHRPFQWNGFDVDPFYTYVIDLSAGEDALIDQFSSDARRNVLDGHGVDYEIVNGDATTVRTIIDQVRRRYEAQDRPYGVTEEFAVDLYESLPPGWVRPYACRVDGEFAGGIVAIDGYDTIYRWQGGARPDTDVSFAVNDHLDWRIMQDAADRGRRYYDLVGAGVPRINSYKAKFNPEVRTRHHAERGTWPVPTMIDIYRKLV